MAKSIFIILLVLSNFKIFSFDLSIKKKEFEIKEGKCTFKINYPNLFLSKKTNLQIEKIQKIESVLKVFFLKIDSFYNEFECNPIDKNSIEFNLNRNYEVKFLNNKILSIHTYTSSFTEGNPHPVTSFWTFNFFLETGEELNLKDIFTINKTFRKKIRNEIQKNLETQKVDSNFKLEKPMFYFSNKEIVFINLFEDYPLESVEVKIHFQELNKFKKENFNKLIY